MYWLSLFYISKNYNIATLIKTEVFMYPDIGKWKIARYSKNELLRLITDVGKPTENPSTEKCFSIAFSPHPIIPRRRFSISEKHLNYKQLIFRRKMQEHDKGCLSQKRHDDRSSCIDRRFDVFINVWWNSFRNSSFSFGQALVVLTKQMFSESSHASCARICTILV